MLDYAEKNFNTPYGYYNNCANFAGNVLSAGGIHVPDTIPLVPTIPNIQYENAVQQSQGAGFSYLGALSQILSNYGIIFR